MAENEVVNEPVQGNLKATDRQPEAPARQLEAPDPTDNLNKEVGAATQKSDVNWGKSSQQIENNNISEIWTEKNEHGNVIANLDKPTSVADLYRDTELGELNMANPAMAYQAGQSPESLLTDRNRREAAVATDAKPTSRQPEQQAFAAPVMERPTSKDAPDAQREVEGPKEGRDAVSEMNPETRESIDRTVEKFEGKYGRERAEKLRENLEKTYERLEDKDRRHVEDPDKELQRITKAMDRVLSSDGKIDGKEIYNGEERAQIVESIGRRSADPEKYANQGFHNTCAIQSKMRSQLETSPADVAEMISEAATTGKATVGPPGARRQIDIHTDSLRLDREARMTGDSRAGDGGKRDAGGQIYDLVAANAYWSQARTDGNGQALGPGERMEYRQSSNPGQGSTGEALVKVNAGGQVVQNFGESPGMTVDRVSEMSYQVDGDQGGVLVHRSLNQRNGRHQVFDDPAEAARMMKDYQERTGRPVQVGVMAGNLGPRAASSGHDLHAMTMWYKGDDASGRPMFKGDNQWGGGADQEVSNMSANDFSRATDRANVTRTPSRQYSFEPEFDPGNKLEPEDRAPQRKVFEDDAKRDIESEIMFQQNQAKYQEGQARAAQFRAQGKEDEALRILDEYQRYNPYQ